MEEEVVEGNADRHVSSSLLDKEVLSVRMFISACSSSPGDGRNECGAINTGEIEISLDGCLRIC